MVVKKKGSSELGMVNVQVLVSLFHHTRVTPLNLKLTYPTFDRVHESTKTPPMVPESCCWTSSKSAAISRSRSCRLSACDPAETAITHLRCGLFCSLFWENGTKLENQACRGCTKCAISTKWSSREGESRGVGGEGAEGGCCNQDRALLEVQTDARCAGRSLMKCCFPAEPPNYLFV